MKNDNYIDVMLDLETLGTVPGSVILSMGACFFDPFTGKIGKEFFRAIDIDSSIESGMQIDGGTLEWWLRDNPEALKATIDVESKETLEEALIAFFNFCDTDGQIAKVRLWANDPSFDTAMIMYACKQTKIPYQLKFWNNRDVRTIVGLYPSNLFKDYKINNQRIGYHTALADAIYQAKYVSYILRDLGCTELY